MKNKISLPNISLQRRRYLLFTIILSLLLLLPLVNNNRLLDAITSSLSTTTTTLGSTHFLTVEKPMLGFKISYPYNWNITDNDFLITFKAPQNVALVTLSITNFTSISKVNLTLEQYSSNEINNIKSDESKKTGNLFKLLESKPHLLSGQPGHDIAFLNGTNADTTYKTLLVWSIIDGKIYQIRYSAKTSEYSNYIETVFYMIDSFRLL
jgi:PsbP-like protein